MALARDGAVVKRLLALLLTLYIVLMAPWRLLVLAAETFAVRPGAPHFTTDDSRFWQAIRLEERLLSMGWSVRYPTQIQFMGQEAYGVTSPGEHVIVVESALHWSARAAVLAHEAGHTVQPIWVSRVEGDCFAESVATLIMHDGYRDHARFLASARWTCLGLMLAEYPAIYRAADLLTD